MSDLETVERLRAQGVDTETVGSILGDAGHGAPTAPPKRFVPARLDGSPELPEPGIYFGMSDDEYHALPALSCSGIKKLAASPMIFWANATWLSDRRRKLVEEAKQGDEKAHYTFGKAYHCRLMEGASVFALRYEVEPDPSSYPDALHSTAQIKAAISRHTQMQPVKPQGGKDDLDAQLRGLCSLHGRSVLSLIPEGTKITVSILKEAIATFEEEAPVVPVRKVEDFMPDTGEAYMRDAVKADWIAQLLALEPEAEIFDVIAQRHREAHPGKVFLSPDQHDELEIAARMVERDPEIKDAFKGGHPEVTLIWYCPTTGVPMKARVDFLKIKMMVDLKSIANQRERSIENAIRFEIAQWKYNLQPVVYFEGAKVVRQMVRDGTAEIHIALDYRPEEEAKSIVDWVHKWARHTLPDEWLWVFQQKGAAPITRGVWFPRGGTTDMVTGEIISQAKRKFRQFSETFGTMPWLDVKPTYTIADEEIPQSATEI